MNGPKEANEMLELTLSRRQQRPVTLTIAAIASIIIGAVGAFYEAGAWGNLLVSNRFAYFESSAGTIFLLVLPLVAYWAAIVFGLGVLLRVSWAWGFGILTQLLLCTNGLWGLLQWLKWSGPIHFRPLLLLVTLLVSVLTLFYLLTPRARQALRHGGHEPRADTSQGRSEAPSSIVGLPLGLAMAAVYGFIICVLEVVLAVHLLSIAGYGTYAIFIQLPALSLILVALAQFIFSVGALMQRRWARRVGIFSQVVQIVVAVGVIWLADFAAWTWDWLLPLLVPMLAIVPAVILVYLFTPAARHALTSIGPKAGAGTEAWSC
jgi:hypothetical protein